MKAFVVSVLTVSLYLITALVTGLHNFYWLMDMVNGASLNALNLTALIGSLTLVVAAVLKAYGTRVAVKIGVVGSLLLWVYYGPLIFVGLSMPSTAQSQIREFISDQNYDPLFGILLGPILLIACTVTLTLSFRLHREVRQTV